MIGIFTIPKTINIYDEDISSIDFEQVRDFIISNFGNVEVRIVRTEKKIIHTKGLLFDLIGTQKSLDDVDTKDSCHIAVTNKIFATYGEDKRLHIRASIYSIPSVISISGIIEGPAKPREFYVYKQKFSSLGVWELKEREIKKKFKGQFIDYDDRRLAEVSKGYFAQALFFYITGEPFCNRKSCRLYNAHWQKDLIYSQIRRGVFCKQHRTALERIREASRKIS